MDNKMLSCKIDTFVKDLWHIVEAQALDGDATDIILGAKKLRRLLEGVDISTVSTQIGEALSGYILSRIVQHSRDYSVETVVSNSLINLLDSTVSNISNTDNDEIRCSEQYSRVILMQSICRLDGVFGVNSNKLLSIAKRYWENIGNTSSLDY